MNTLIKLSEQLVESLKKNKLHITTVESCTGGGMANWITNVSGASEVMKDSFITYSNEAKVALGVSEFVIKNHTVYSIETSLEMAKSGINRSVKANVGVGITGSLSRIDPVNENSIPGEVYISVVKGDEAISDKLQLVDCGARWEIKDKVIEKALEMAIQILD